MIRGYGTGIYWELPKIARGLVSPVLFPQSIHQNLADIDTTLIAKDEGWENETPSSY